MKKDEGNGGGGNIRTERERKRRIGVYEIHIYGGMCQHIANPVH